jgi:DNA-binding transcriptional ArsR family regulator
MAESRQITDARVLAALSHPLRRRLMDVLRVDGPATASMLAERTGQAVGNVSHHMKVLAGGDLVAEAPELARDRRERWWRIATPGVRWSSDDFRGDPTTEAVVRAAESLNLQRQVELVRTWQGAGEDERAGWPTGPFSTDKWLRLTPAELAELSREVIDLFNRWQDRAGAAAAAADGIERQPVFVFAHGVPARP